ncbi:MAG: glycosyltransferase family 2 protein [Methylococcaceae bacterium]
MNNAPIELSIVMPCLNEELTLAVCISKAKAFFETQQIIGEIVIADNGSTDRSIEIATAAGARVVSVQEKGYGSALMGGIHAAQGTYVIMGDADDSYDFSDLSLFLERLQAGDQLVMGNRFKGGIKPGAMPFLHRYLGNPVLSFIGRLFFKSAINDFHCGLRGFNRQAILALNLKTTGMEFASEMIVKASINQLQMAEVPTILHPDGRNRAPHLRTWRDGWRHLIFLLMYAPRWLFLYPGLAVTFLGSLGMLLILPGPLAIGSVVLDIHTLLLSATAIIIGVQTVFAFLLAKQFTLKFGLLFEEPNYVTWFNKQSLEFLLILGGSAILIGGGCVLYSVSFWQQQAFGHLEPASIMRLLVPGITLLIVGFQTILTGFLRAILNLPVHQ